MIQMVRCGLSLHNNKFDRFFYDLFKQNKEMTYFTSWDINLVLCLVSWGLPDDVIKWMMKMAKKTHEEFSLQESMDYWVKNAPTLVRIDHPSRLKRLKFYVPNDNDRGRTRIDVWKKRMNNTIEFKKEWKIRSIEMRKAKVIEWCKFGDDRSQERHHNRLNIVSMPRLSQPVKLNEWVKESSDLKEERKSYTKNLWKTWNAWSHCEHPPMIMSWDTVRRPQPQDRRNYISKWYEGIHLGRFFLFFKENEIIEERHRGIPKGPCEDGYQYSKTPIFDWGPYEQLIEDLRCIDGPGLGESGTKVEHIDDLFS